MKELHSLYIERNNCENCYRCIRECTVKAVYLEKKRVRIDYNKCIRCGACIAACKAGVIKLRNDIHIARGIIGKYSIKVASVSPEWITEFPGVDGARFVEALKCLGFTHVSESALGAEQSLEKERRIVEESGGIGISARCPAVLDYVQKHQPSLKSLLLPVATPMTVHARMIKGWWGHDAQVVHFSSCPSMKHEAARYGDIISAVLSFRELKKWLKDEGIVLDKIDPKEGQFEPYTAKLGLDYTLCGTTGQNGQALKISASTIPGVISTLANMPSDPGTAVWLDLMACAGGCAGSACRSAAKYSKVSDVVAFDRIIRARSHISEGYSLPPVDLKRTDYVPALLDDFVPESDTVSSLEELGIGKQTLQTDCNACGFGTCRRFAKALSRGDVRRDMCWQYLKQEAVSKFTALIARMSSGVAVVNDKMRIGESNRLLATMLGPDAERTFEFNPGLRDMDAADVLPFADLIASVLENGDDSLVRDVQVHDKMLTVSVHSIQKYKSVLVICRNMLFSQVRNEEIVSRTRKVIDGNLETARKIALLLGENVSRTEAVLNSILDSQIRESDG